MKNKYRMLKKRNLIALMVCLLMGLCACAGPQHEQRKVQSTESANIVYTDAWPENQYTDNLPVPKGEVEWVSEDDNGTSVSLKDVKEKDFKKHLKKLEDERFTSKAQDTEEIKNQGKVSFNHLVEDDERAITVSYFEKNLVLRISMKKQPQQ